MSLEIQGLFHVNVFWEKYLQLVVEAKIVMLA